MSQDLSDLINNVKDMIDSGNIPDNMKEILKDLNNSSNLNNSASSGSSNLDVDTILKMKTVIDNLNQGNDPRANLLYSLKPYLRESRKNKLDQYVNMLNITKIISLINNEQKENNGNV